MRYAPRRPGPAPPCLKKKNRKGKTEFELALAYYEPAPGQAPPTTAYAFKAYKGEEVKRALEALFHGKCAYCESYYASTAPVDIEHYRPKGGVEGEIHAGYWWLAAEWSNLLPSCIDCNRRRKQRTPSASGSLAQLQRDANLTLASLIMGTGKKDCFPIAGPRAADRHSQLELEQPLLLNPCVDDPAQDLMFNVDARWTIGLVLPRAGAAAALPLADAGDAAAVADHAEGAGMSVRGAVSIQVYGLNRLGLVQQRTRILRQLEFLGSLIIDLAVLRDRVDAELKKGKNQLLADVSAKLAELEGRVYGEIAGMKHNSAPHSALVTAWLTSFLKRIA